MRDAKGKKLTKGGCGAASNNDPLQTDTKRDGQLSHVQVYPPKYGNFDAAVPLQKDKQNLSFIIKTKFKF